MAGISAEDIQKVRDASDIVDLFSERVPLRQKGREFWCCCPFHEEKTPSCKVDPNTQLFYCFGCHKGGDVFKFVQEIEGIDFPDAVRRLADRARIELAEQAGHGVSSSYKARLRDVCQNSMEYFHTQLMRLRSTEADTARSYLASRGLGGDIPKHWKLGFAPGGGALVAHLRQAGFSPKEMLDANVAVSRNGKTRDRFFNRIMFPILDEAGECIAFGGRVVGTGEPKYLNSQETPLFHKSSVLYGLDKAKASLTSTGIAIVVEGYTDVIALHEAGVTNVVATLGTALTKQHIRSISRYASKRIVYLFDGDAAGQRAADRALEFIDESITEQTRSRHLDLVACTLPDNLDPADFVAAHGADALRAQVDQAVPLVAYGIERRLAAHDVSTPEGRAAAVDDAISVLAPIKDTLMAKEYARFIAGKLLLRENDVIAQLAKLKAPRGTYMQRNRAESGPLEAGAGSSAPDEAQRTSIGSAEEARLNMEAELVGTCARNPQLALQHAEALSAVNWHLALHANIVAALLQELTMDPGISAANLASRVTSLHPNAARVIASPAAKKNLVGYVDYLLEGIAIGDLEDAIDFYRAQISDPSAFSHEEYLELHQTVTQLQAEVQARRRALGKVTLE